MNGYVHAESVKLVSSGAEYFDLLSELISSAKEIIHMQTYIIEDDATGKEIKEKLIKAAERGVKIFFLADAFGSKGLSEEFIKEMRSAGIRFRFFSPLFSSEGVYLGRRLHHKIVVADKSTGLVGGINIADKYHGTEQAPPWLDYAVMIKGSCCEYLNNICEGIFLGKKIIETRQETERGVNGSLIRFRRNDWVRGKNQIHNSYKETLLKAERSVTIMASYFLPGIRFQKLIKRAVKRGVAVRLIVTGKTDVPFFHLAEKYLHRRLLKLGAEVYEWKNSVLHGKVMLADDQWVTVGSYNLNYLSHYRSIEMNVDVMDAEFSKEVSRHLNGITEKYCYPVTNGLSDNKPGIFQDLKRSIAYHLIRITMYLLLPKRRINT